MEFFTWTTVYSVENEFLDEQHKRLIQMVNGLYEAMLAGRGNEVLGTLFNNLLTYTSMHFAEEEELMSRYGFPLLSEHRQEHQRMTQHVEELADKFRSGKTDLTVYVAKYLKEWLTSHIQSRDQCYRPYLKQEAGSLEGDGVEET